MDMDESLLPPIAFSDVIEAFQAIPIIARLDGITR